MTQSIRNSLREAPDGRSAGEFAQDRLVVHPSNWATMSGTLAVKAMATHVNAFRQGVKAAGKRSVQSSGDSAAEKKHKKNLLAKRAKAREKRNEEEEEEDKKVDEEEDEGGGKE
jgi:hypothetical protein